MISTEKGLIKYDKEEDALKNDEEGGTQM